MKIGKAIGKTVQSLGGGGKEETLQTETINYTE